jgi:hypothetical protein
MTQEYYDWLDLGISNKWISNPFCNTHDGDPYMTQEEDEEWERGGDPCMPVVKLIWETGYNEDNSR